MKGFCRTERITYKEKAMEGGIMRIVSKITAALFAAAVVGAFASNVVYAGGHHARAVCVDAHCYQNGGICAGTVSQLQNDYGYHAGCYSSNHHAGRVHGAYH